MFALYVGKETWLPQHHRPLAGRRSVVSNLDETISIVTTQPRRMNRRTRRRRTRHHKHRRSAIRPGQAVKTSQNKGNMSAKHPAIRVTLIHNDVSQVAQQSPPPRMRTQHRQLHHVRVGENPLHTIPNSAPGLWWSIAVIPTDTDTPERTNFVRHPRHMSQLIIRERLRRCQIQGSRILFFSKSGQNRHLVTERLSRRGAGGHHRVTPLPQSIRDAHLMGPRPCDALVNKVGAKIPG